MKPEDERVVQIIQSWEMKNDFHQKENGTRNVEDKNG
jgi:hypothetical protein